MSRTTILIALALTLGCQTAPFVWVDDLPPSLGEVDLYRLHAGDKVNVDVYGQKELSVTRTIRPDGRASLPLIGDVHIAGLTPPDAAAAIGAKIQTAELVIAPKVSLSVDGGGRAFIVTVLGEVKQPGQYPVDPNDSLLQILGKAGGLTEFASLGSLYIVRADHDPARIRFSYRKLSQGVGKGLSFRLHDGDVVVVE